MIMQGASWHNSFHLHEKIPGERAEYQRSTSLYESNWLFNYVTHWLFIMNLSSKDWHRQAQFDSMREVNSNNVSYPWRNGILRDTIHKFFWKSGPVPSVWNLNKKNRLW